MHPEKLKSTRKRERERRREQRTQQTLATRRTATGSASLLNVLRPFFRGVDAIGLGLGRPLASTGLVPRLLLAPVDPRARPSTVGQDDARGGRHFRQGQDRRGRVRRLLRPWCNPLEARIAGDS